eukprot:SAG11_NODE_2551_length_3229_cov_2.569649_3_plen_257_part_00
MRSAVAGVPKPIAARTPIVVGANEIVHEEKHARAIYNLRVVGAFRLVRAILKCRCGVFAWAAPSDTIRTFGIVDVVEAIERAIDHILAHRPAPTAVVLVCTSQHSCQLADQHMAMQCTNVLIDRFATRALWFCMLVIVVLKTARLHEIIPCNRAAGLRPKGVNRSTIAAAPSDRPFDPIPDNVIIGSAPPIHRFGALAPADDDPIVRHIENVIVGDSGLSDIKRLHTRSACVFDASIGHDIVGDTMVAVLLRGVVD